MRELDHAKVTEGWLHICKHLNGYVHIYMHTYKYIVFSYTFYWFVFFSEELNLHNKTDEINIGWVLIRSWSTILPFRTWIFVQWCKGVMLATRGTSTETLFPLGKWTRDADLYTAVLLTCSIDFCCPAFFLIHWVPSAPISSLRSWDHRHTPSGLAKQCLTLSLVRCVIMAHVFAKDTL